MTHEEISPDAVDMYKMIREGKRRAHEEGLKAVAAQFEADVYTPEEIFDSIENYRDSIPELSLGGQIQVHGKIFELTSISYGDPATLHFKEKL